MTHTIYNSVQKTEIEVDETLCEKTQIGINDLTDETRAFIYLSPKLLNDLIGTLLHVQAKKRKQYKTGY